MSDSGRNPGFTSRVEKSCLRPALPEDEEFRFSLFCASRAPDYCGTGWSGSQLELLLRMQFRAREQSYAARFPESCPALVLVAGRPAGCVWLTRSEDEYRLVNIEILPEFRNRGIGSAVVRQFLEEAGRGAKPVRLSVAKANSGTIRFYSRIGFRRCGADGVYLELELWPAGTAS